MNTLYVLTLIISTVCILSLNNAAPTGKRQDMLTIRGRVTYINNPRLKLESGAKLNVVLQDVSIADAPAKPIAKLSSSAIRFPMAFSLQYLPSQIKQGSSYSIGVTITNKKNQLLYHNDVRATVVPLGPNRTKNIDVPVVSVTTTKSGKSTWPELVGKKGEDAVRIIKNDTGFTNVAVVKIGSPVTLDYRNDRVRVLVGNDGLVIMAPMIA